MGGATLRELVAALNGTKPNPREILVVPLLGGQGGQASPDLQVNDIASRVSMVLADPTYIYMLPHLLILLKHALR